MSEKHWDGWLPMSKPEDGELVVWMRGPDLARLFAMGGAFGFMAGLALGLVLS